MDKLGFSLFLQKYKLTQEQNEESVRIAERFDVFSHEPGRMPDAETAWQFSRQLINEGINTEENYIALIRYCRYIQNNPMFVALLELVDGGEVGNNLFQRVAEQYGSEFRDEIFEGIGVVPYGTPSPEKPAFLHPVIERLEARVGNEACKAFLSPSLRDLPDEPFLGEREKYRQSGNLDVYLKRKKEDFLGVLEACQRDGRLFFSQEITPEVLSFVRDHPEMGGGKREGSILFETKIPYMTRQYLEETDPVLRRYYACHCPWAREAIKNSNVKLMTSFCQCSGGFHKKPFEVIFQQSLKVEVLNSVLMGDDYCRFAIFLPEEALDFSVISLKAEFSEE